MSQAAHETYLETQVLTATPQKLRLMLIDGALRFGRQALECWGDAELAQRQCSALGRCNEILSELYGSIRDDELAVANQTKDVYRFLLLQLAQISSQDDPQGMRDVVEILEVERETWRMVCEQMPEAPPREDVQRDAGEITARGVPAINPQSPMAMPCSAPTTSQLSLEA